MNMRTGAAVAMNPLHTGYRQAVGGVKRSGHTVNAHSDELQEYGRNGE